MSEITAASVTCNHCGAPLDVPPGTRFVTCAHCGSRLEVHRTGNALYTEVLEAIDQRTQAIAEDVDVIRRQNEIERLDREWQMRREELLVRTKRGAHPPSVAGGIVGAVFAVGFGIFWMIVTSRSGAPGFLPFVGMLVAVVGIGGGISTVSKATRYVDEQRRYEQQRARLMRSDSPLRRL